MIVIQLKDWYINANYPYLPLMTSAVETGTILNGIFHDIKATVPGCVHNDLLRAGMIPDPYYEMNSLQSAWVSDYWWTYTTTFSLDPSLKGRNMRLRFNGIDYEGTVSLNGKIIGHQKGMYVPFKCDVTDRLVFPGPNKLTVVLRNSPEEMGQIGYTSKVHTQKARFCYKWDFSTRLVQVGLYDTVTVEAFGAAAIEYMRLYADVEDGKGTVKTDMEVTAFDDKRVRVEYTLLFGDKIVGSYTRTETLKKGTCHICADLDVDSPKLWYPSGAGEQPIYTLRAEIYDDEGLSDRGEWQVGFRKLEYVRAEGAPEDCIPYGVVINGKRIYIKGVNMVPLDIMYGRIQPETVERFLRMVKDANCNLVRIWGGGLIESEWFYNLCDRLGLMVWQEFIQSSSGIDDVPSKLPEFLDLCRATATEAVKQKQHHVCLTFWCGGNELRDENGVPATFEDENLHMLKEIVDEYDGRTLMLPTSATGSHEFLDVERPGTNFDVHGPWLYAGPEAHYEIYNKSDSQLHSEFGVDGMSNYRSLLTFLSEENLKVQGMGNSVWRYHGEMWDTLPRDRKIFGPIEEHRLEDFIVCSQFIQAEGLRYAIEANRRRAFANVGSIIWQFNEPWPNVSCTNLVDYYGEPKLAYYAVKIAFRQVNPSLRYDKLVYAPGESATVQPWISSDSPVCDWHLTVKITDSEGHIIADSQQVLAAGDGRSAAGEPLTFAMPGKGVVYVELTAADDGRSFSNRYILFVRDEDGYADRGLALAFAGCLKTLAEE